MPADIGALAAHAEEGEQHQPGRQRREAAKTRAEEALALPGQCGEETKPPKTAVDAPIAV